MFKSNKAVKSATFITVLMAVCLSMKTWYFLCCFGSFAKNNVLFFYLFVKTQGLMHALIKNINDKRMC